MTLTINHEPVIADLLRQRSELLAALGRIEKAITSLGGMIEPERAPQVSDWFPSGSNRAETQVGAIEQKTKPRNPYISASNRNAPVPPAPGKPDHGQMPSGAEESWVSMIASEASPFALALAVIREHEGSQITTAQLNLAVGKIRGIKGNVGYVIVGPLQEAGVIAGENNVWTILNRDAGGIIANGFLWADPKNLSVYDWAGIRREALLALLQRHPNTSNAALTKSLLACKWMRAPVTTHLLKSDLRTLEKDRKVKQNSEDRTWSLVGE